MYSTNTSSLSFDMLLDCQASSGTIKHRKDPNVKSTGLGSEYISQIISRLFDYFVAQEFNLWSVKISRLAIKSATIFRVDR